MTRAPGEYRPIGRAIELQDVSVCLRCGALVSPSWEDAHTAEHDHTDNETERINHIEGI
jgi:hypothetical protein